MVDQSSFLNVSAALSLFSAMITTMSCSRLSLSLTLSFRTTHTQQCASAAAGVFGNCAHIISAP